MQKKSKGTNLDLVSFSSSMLFVKYNLFYTVLSKWSTFDKLIQDK